MRYQVQAPWRNREYKFETLEAACGFASAIFEKTGVVVAVEKVS